MTAPTLMRFRGALLAAIALAALLAIAAWQGLFSREPEPGWNEEVRLFEFEKDAMRAIRIERSDLSLELVRDGDEWRAVGQPWRPSRTMVRRVAHQIHDLTSRAVVVEGVTDPDRYGLGSEAVRVTIGLEDGREVAFEAGEANPTGVSHYVRPLPGDTVYVVKKASMDYYRMPLDAFREPKFAQFDAATAVHIEATVDGRHLAFTRVAERSWRMDAPVAQPASLDEVRTLLGRLSALRADAYLADDVSDLGAYGPVAHTMKVELEGGGTVTVEIGREVADDRSAILRVEDRAIYEASADLLRAYRLTVEEYRDKVLVGGHEWELEWLEASRGEESVRIHRTSDTWRWPDGAPISGATPRRVGSHATGLLATGYRDGEELGPVETTVRLGLPDGERVIRLGPLDGEIQRVQVDDGPTALVAAELDEVLDDLFREYARKRESDVTRGAGPG